MHIDLLDVRSKVLIGAGCTITIIEVFFISAHTSGATWAKKPRTQRLAGMLRDLTRKSIWYNQWSMETPAERENWRMSADWRVAIEQGPARAGSMAARRNSATRSGISGIRARTGVTMAAGASPGGAIGTAGGRAAKGAGENGGQPL